MKKYMKWGSATIMLVVFFIIMYLVVNNKIESFDNAVYSVVTHWSNPALDNLYKVFTFFGSVAFVVSFCIIALVIIIWTKDKRNIFIVASAAIATIINNIIKFIVRRERPLVRRLVEEHSYSFPSGHTMGAVALYGIIIFFICKSKMSKAKKVLFSVLLGVLVLGIMVSRIYLGAHFASDILAGVLASLVFLIVFTHLMEKAHFMD